MGIVLTLPTTQSEGIEQLEQGVYLTIAFEDGQGVDTGQQLLKASQEQVWTIPFAFEA